MFRVAVSFVLLLTASLDARPCSPPCGVVLVVPSGGDVPANLPGLRWWYHGPGVASEDVVRVTERLQDGSTSQVPVERYYEGGGGNQVRFGRHLVPGATYTVEVMNGCSYGAPKATSTFRAREEAPLPDSLGTIAVAQRAIQRAEAVWTSSGSCTSEAVVVARELELALSEGAFPWRNALVADWYQGQYAVSVLGDVFGFAPTDPEAYWKDWSIARPYHVCSSDDPGVEPGAPEGTFEIAVRASLPGSAHTIREAIAVTTLECENPGCDLGAGSTTLFGLVALILRWLWRSMKVRRRARDGAVPPISLPTPGFRSLG